MICARLIVAINHICKNLFTVGGRTRFVLISSVDDLSKWKFPGDEMYLTLLINNEK